MASDNESMEKDGDSMPSDSDSMEKDGDSMASDSDSLLRSMIASPDVYVIAGTYNGKTGKLVYNPTGGVKALSRSGTGRVGMTFTRRFKSHPTIVATPYYDSDGPTIVTFERTEVRAVFTTYGLDGKKKDAYVSFLIIEQLQ